MSLKIMADNGVEISAKQDGALYNVAMNDQDFIIKDLGNEFAMSYSGLNVTIQSGEAIVHGRHITAEESNNITLPANESGYLVLRIDLTRLVGEEALFYATPTLTHEEINWDGTIYDMPIATFQTNTIDVVQFEDVRKIISRQDEEIIEYIDDKNTWKQILNTEYLAQETKSFNFNIPDISSYKELLIFYNHITNVIDVKILPISYWLVTTSGSRAYFGWNVTSYTADVEVWKNSTIGATVKLNRNLSSRRIIIYAR